MIHEKSKGAAEAVTFEIDFVRAIETVHRTGKRYALTQFVRAPDQTGYEYECTNAGTTAWNPPAFGEVIAGTFNDGTVEWTTRDDGDNAIDLVSSYLVSAPSGITLVSDSQSGTKILAKISGGTIGQVYDVPVKITTAGGEIYIETLRVTVTE